MSFVPLREPTARIVMRSGLQNFLAKMADALAISVDEALNLARVTLSEISDDDDGATDVQGRS